MVWANIACHINNIALNTSRPKGSDEVKALLVVVVVVIFIYN